MTTQEKSEIYARMAKKYKSPDEIRAEKSSRFDGAAKMRASAKRGDLRLDYTDDEIVGAVKHGAISMSDAMNQDF